MIGRTVGNYVIQRLLGQGGMGAVYLAEHPRIGRKVAVKVLLPQLSQNPELVRRFFNEARAATAIANDHIIDVLDFGELPDGASYIVMEWLDGQSLATLLASAKKLPLDRALAIARGIGEALAAAHAHGIVHRDLKPDNIFLVRKGGDPEFVKVLDFGIAKLLADEGADLKTRAGAIMGTPHYMSPEQCNGAPVDQRTDVYALGVILYEMITGRLPFAGSALVELLMAHVSQPPPALRTLDGTIPPEVEQAVLMALAKSPDDRFQRVEALIAAVGARPLPTASIPSAPAAAPRPAPSPVRSSLVTVPPAVVDAPPPPSPKRPLPILVRIALGVGGIFLLLVGIKQLRYRDEDVPPRPHPLPASASQDPAPPPPKIGPATPPPSPAKKKSNAVTWVLTWTNCPPGAMAQRAKVTTSGGRVTIRAAGYPDVHGMVDDDGDFNVANEHGQCRGHTEDGVSTETCTAANGYSCQATYSVKD